MYDSKTAREENIPVIIRLPLIYTSGNKMAVYILLLNLQSLVLL